MILLKLDANKSTFKTIRFNPSGLSLIVGRRSNLDDHSLEHSKNGVGKSLALYLIDFCLGSKPNANMGDKLSGWIFELEFSCKGQKHIVTRSTSDQGKVNLDGTTIKLSNYHEELGEMLFSIHHKSKIKYLTYRTLIGQFLRQGKAGYIEFDQMSSNDRQYTKQIRTSFLLGLDKALVDKKRELRVEGERLREIQKQFKKDSLLREYYLGERNAAIELGELDDQITQLEKQIRDYKVSDNYEQMEAAAERTRQSWKESRNNLHGLTNSLKQIERSMQQQPELGLEHVLEMYNSAKLQLPELISKKIDEVTEFHTQLIATRNKRLAEEKYAIDTKIAELERVITQLEVEKDRYFSFLGSHGALIEYEMLIGRLSDLKSKSSRLLDYQELVENFEERSQANKLEFSQEDIAATKYIKSNVNLRDEHNLRFRSLAKRIWPNSTAGLAIKNNSGENMKRFDIEPKLQAESSDGVGESKLFCFDMTVLIGAKNHNVKTLSHDNRLFAAIDERQRAEVFRTAHEVTKASNCQYIASINDDNLKSMEPEFVEQEFENLFTANTVLELTDASDSGKLLGVVVDLDYGK